MQFKMFRISGINFYGINKSRIVEYNIIRLSEEKHRKRSNVFCFCVSVNSTLKIKEVSSYPILIMYYIHYPWPRHELEVRSYSCPGACFRCVDASQTDRYDFTKGSEQRTHRHRSWFNFMILGVNGEWDSWKKYLWLHYMSCPHYERLASRW